MTKGLPAAILALAAAMVLTACSDTADLQAESLAHWKAFCAAKGKQFLWKDTSAGEDFLIRHVQVEGKCVGPGERGYRPPEPPDDEP